jgi:mannose-6-phosphate isomerase-like protein (cupin superfamily)
VTTRRIVTGVDKDRRSVVAEDAVLEATVYPSGNSILDLWGSDAPVVLPTSGARPPTTAPLPPRGGFRCCLFVLPAGDPERGPGMHATDTVDVAMVVSGTVVMRLGGGETVELASGDVVVQNGTEHRWENIGDSEAVIAVFTVGADRRS